MCGGERESCLIHDLVKSSEGKERSGREGGDTVVCVKREGKMWGRITMDARVVS